VEGEGEGPEAVGVAMAVAFAGEADVAGGGGFFADGTKVGADGFVGGDADGLVFKGGADGIGEVFLDGSGKVNAFNAIGAEFFDGAFGELAAKAGLIDATAADGGVLEDGIEGKFLGIEGLFVKY
jgi:hypothetical protein